MNAKELAAKINGIEYNIPCEIETLAKENGLVIVHGASDDLMEFRGAIHDEVDCFCGGKAFLNSTGLIQNLCDDDRCPYFQEELKRGAIVRAIWHDKGNPCWTYSTYIPHETFNMMEDGELYCIGIVFALTDVPGVKA